MVTSEESTQKKPFKFLVRKGSSEYKDKRKYLTLRAFICQVNINEKITFN